MKPVFKISEVDGSKPRDKKELPPNLKGKIIIFDIENSEVAKNLEIKEKGVYSTKAA